MSGRIHVCPLSAVPDVVAGCEASHLLTCLQDEVVVETPTLIKLTTTCGCSRRHRTTVAG
jgi:hypothetical protein